MQDHIPNGVITAGHMLGRAQQLIPAAELIEHCKLTQSSMTADSQWTIDRYPHYLLCDVPLSALSEIHKIYPDRLERAVSERKRVSGAAFPAIVVQLDTGEIVDGNHRHRAAKLAGESHIPALIGIADAHAWQTQLVDHTRYVLGLIDTFGQTRAMDLLPSGASLCSGSGEQGAISGNDRVQCPICERCPSPNMGAALTVSDHWDRQLT